MGIGGFGGSAGASSTTKKANGIGGFSGGTAATKKGDGGSPLDDVKKLGGKGVSLVGKALLALDLPRAALLAEGRQLGGALQGKGFNADEMLRQIKEHEGFGELVENADLPMNVKRAIGFVGDVALDPLMYMTAGVGTGVKAVGLRAVDGGVEAGAKKAVRITAEQAARELDGKGARAAANKVLKRHSVNALSAEEAAAAGIRQGPTIGFAGRRVAIPGGDVAARGVSNTLAPFTERLHEVIPLRGRVSEAAKGLEPVAALRLKDAERTARLSAKGMAHAHLGQLNRVLQDGDIDADAVRAALEGVGGSNPTAVKLRGILDSVAARTEELTGQRVPRVEHYLPHRLTAEAKAELANAGRSGTRGTTAVMKRAYRPGEKFLGVELVDGSIDELNRIASDKGFHQLFKDDPIQLVHAYINEMKAYAQRAGVPFRLSTDNVATKTIGAPGSRAAKKGIKAKEAEMAALGSDLEGRLAKAGLMDPQKHLAQADELEGRAQELYGKGTTFDGPRLSNPAIEKAANDYIAREGLAAATPVDRALRVDEDFATRLAKAYDELPAKGGPEAEKAYKALAEQVDKQYDYLTSELGIKVEFVNADPYADAAEMMADVAQNKRLKVFTGGTEHPLLTAEQNNRFRAVHDFFGHAQAGNRFDRHGEEVAFRLHAQMFPSDALPAMATETRGQNAYLNYHPDNVARKAAGQAAEFPAQKAAILPSEFGAVVPTPNDLTDKALRTNGFTVQPKTGALPTEGFAVAVRGAEESFPPPSSPEELAQLIQAYIAKHASDFEDEAAHLGGWVDEESGQLFLDVSRILPDRGAAEQFGREQGQLAIRDLAKGEDIRLPREAAQPSVGGGQGGVGDRAVAAPVAASVSADFAASVGALRGRLEDVEKKLKSNAKELANPKLGPAAKGIFERRTAELEARRASVLEEVKSLQAQVRNENRVKVVEQSPPFDHVVAATNTEAAAVQAAENLQKLEALKAANAQRATEKRLAEVAAREHAEALFAESVKLRAIGNDELAIISSLQGMAAKTEADFKRLDGELGALRLLANRKKVVVDGKAMAMRGLRDLGNGRYAEPWVAEAVGTLDEALRPENVRALLKTYDRVSTYWRSAALLSPGFHERNFLGGMFNNSLARMDTRRYYDFAVANRQFKRGGLEAVENKEVRGAMRAAMDLGQYEGADITDVAVLSQGEGGRIIGSQNPLFRANLKAGQVVERNLRMPLFIDTYIKTGGSEQAALDAVMTYHFDYEDLSRMERVVARRTFAFYTWTRKNLPLQLLNMVDQPGKYTAYLHLKRNVEQGTPEDDVMPSFFERQLAIRLPFKADGGRMYAMPELPFINTSEALGVEEIAASLNPIIKTPLEALTNHKFFEQRSFKSGLEETPKTWLPILQVLRSFDGKLGLPRVYKAADGTLMMSEHEAAKIESLVPVLARMRRLAPSEKKYQDRALTSWLSFAFGISARTLDEATVGGEVMRRQQEAQRSANLKAQLAGGSELAAFKAAEAVRKRREAGR